MSTYHDLAVGDVFSSSSRLLDAELCAELVRLGGYTHPLFTDQAFAASTPIGRVPVPGEALLLVMGGLMEQTERFDDTTIALVGFDRVAFAAPAFAGDTVHVVAQVLAKEPSSSGSRGTLVFSWRCVNDAGAVLVDATARMLFRIPDRPPAV